jgi:hypothetical protein
MKTRTGIRAGANEPTAEMSSLQACKQQKEYWKGQAEYMENTRPIQRTPPTPPTQPAAVAMPVACITRTAAGCAVSSSADESTYDARAGVVKMIGANL